MPMPMPMLVLVLGYFASSMPLCWQNPILNLIPIGFCHE